MATLRNREIDAATSDAGHGFEATAPGGDLECLQRVDVQRLGSGGAARPRPSMLASPSRSAWTPRRRRSRRSS